MFQCVPDSLYLIFNLQHQTFRLLYMYNVKCNCFKIKLHLSSEEENYEDSTTNTFTTYVLALTFDNTSDFRLGPDSN